MSSDNLFLKSISKMFNNAIEILDIDKGLANQIKSCNSTHTIRFGVKLDKGIKVFTGWRAVHSEHLEPCLLYTSPSPRDVRSSRMPSSA